LDRTTAGQKRPRHAEMDHHIAPSLERHQDEFAVAFDACDLAAFEPLGHVLGIAAAKNAQATELRGYDPPADQVRNRPGDGFDFGKLRHFQKPGGESRPPPTSPDRWRHAWRDHTRTPRCGSRIPKGETGRPRALRGFV